MQAYQHLVLTIGKHIDSIIGASLPNLGDCPALQTAEIPSLTLLNVPSSSSDNVIYINLRIFVLLIRLGWGRRH